MQFGKVGNCARREKDFAQQKVRIDGQMPPFSKTVFLTEAWSWVGGRAPRGGSHVKMLDI